jgi:hypothetical protein
MANNLKRKRIYQQLAKSAGYSERQPLQTTFCRLSVLSSPIPMEDTYGQPVELICSEHTTKLVSDPLKKSTTITIAVIALLISAVH